MATINTNKSGDYTKLRVLAVPFGSPSNKDLHGEYFTPNTDFGLSALGEQHVVYACFDHLKPINPLVKSDPNSAILGRARFVEKTEEGLFYEIEIARSHKYHDAILRLAQEGYLGVSTGAIPNSKIVNDNGEILRWLPSEVSLTVTPANIDTVNKTKVMKAFEILGINPIEIIEEEASMPQEAAVQPVAEASETNSTAIDELAKALTEALRGVQMTEKPSKTEPEESKEDTSMKSSEVQEEEVDEVKAAAEEVVNALVQADNSQQEEETVQKSADVVDVQQLASTISALESRLAELESVNKSLEEVKNENAELKAKMDSMAKHVSVEVLRKLAEVTRNRTFANAAVKAQSDISTEEQQPVASETAQKSVDTSGVTVVYP